jgi:hypothetical protein
MRLPSTLKNERGMALASTLMALLLIMGLMVGAFAALNADLRSNAIDRDQSQAYAAAHAGLEQLTSDLASLFLVNVSPTVGQINALTATPPAIPGFQFTAPGGGSGSGYAITWNGFPGAPQVLQNMTITAGSLAGFKGLITPYTMTVTARSTTGGAEVRLRREINTVAVPVFQFGVFSEGDLTFYAGDDFNFGGRVHTNGHLFLSGTSSGNKLSFSDKITAVGDVVLQNMSNGQAVAMGGFANNTVQIYTGVSSNGGYTVMSQTMGSITGSPLIANLPTPPPAYTVPANAVANWATYSNGSSYFKGNIKNRFTGATLLRLPLVSQGANPIDLIRRPALNSNEDAPPAIVFGQRFFGQASLRILLSDRAADITGPALPSVSAAPPVDLNANWNTTPPAGYVVAANRPPLARSVGPFAANTTINANPTNVAANNYTISVNAIPAQFVLPQISVQKPDGTWFTTTCTGKSGVRNTGAVDALYANQFTGCNPTLPILLPSGRTVTATLPGGGTATTTTNTFGTQNILGGSTLTVQNYGTAAFVPIQFFTHNNGNTVDFPTLVSCTGYSAAANDFYGCTWNSVNAPGVAPGNNHTLTTAALQNLDEALIGGFIRIERQDSNGGAGGTWTDVTAEILGLGIGAPNQEGVICADPTPDAILRIQRLKDNGFPGPPAGNTPAGPPTWTCPAASTDGQNWWPNTLYDAREGIFRNVALDDPPKLGGAMQYIALDVRNLKRWLNGEIGASGPGTLNRNGYIVYFSDRRGDHDDTVAANETGKYGNEDIVNRNSASGAPNNALDAGEDLDGWGADNVLGTADDEPGAGTLEVYGKTPYAPGGQVPWAVNAPALAAAPNPLPNPYSAAGRHERDINSAIGRTNRVVLFRRALKLVNGGISGGVNSLPTAGLTVASENPVYVQGNYNSLTDPNDNPDNDATQPNVGASIVADAVTVLSNNWTDARSFRVPHNMAGRPAGSTGFRFAVIAGKNASFPFAGTSVPAGTVGLLGTDGGMGNFLRLLEDWNQNGNVNINYRGSMISLYTSRQATGVFKYMTNGNVYDFGVRKFKFDNDFLVPGLLPPGTPMFRDVNTLNFRQMLRPTQ